MGVSPAHHQTTATPPHDATRIDQSAGARADGSTVSSTATNPSTMSGTGWVRRGTERPRTSVHNPTLVSPCTRVAIEGPTRAVRRNRIVISSITAATTTTSISTSIALGGSEESTSCQLVMPSSTSVAKIGSQRRAALSCCIYTLSVVAVAGKTQPKMGVTALCPLPQRSGGVHGQRPRERLADHLLAVHRRQHQVCGTGRSGVEEQLHRSARLAGELAAAGLAVDEGLLVDVLEDGIDRCQRSLHKGPDADLTDDGITDVVDRNIDLQLLAGDCRARNHATEIRHRRSGRREERRDDSKEETEDHHTDNDQEDGSRVVLRPAPDGCEHAWSDRGRRLIVAEHAAQRAADLPKGRLGSNRLKDARHQRLV